MKTRISRKQLQINKANGSIFALLVATSVVTVFSLVVSRTLIIRSTYQHKVITERKKTNKQLQDNIKSVAALVDKYKEFDGAAENVLGGNPDPNATGPLDGPNSRIVLDALPSKYDFPALTSSLEKILIDGGYKIDSITGSDDEVAQSVGQSSPDPSPKEMPLSFQATAAYTSVQKLISDFERSIRPFKISTIEFAGGEASMRVSVNAKTYYQPEKNLDITTKVVK